MRAAIIVSGFIALGAAQSIDFGLVSAAPSVVVQSAPVTGTAQVVSAKQTEAASTIAADSVEESPLPQAVHKRDGTCATQPAGTGPTVRPDTVANFENFQYFDFAAVSAPVPRGYSLSFVNSNASTSTSSYLGYTVIANYDTLQCARLCNAQTGCVAFNLYFERDPTLDPNAVSCPNPPSLTNIKCVLWGVPISQATATNQGQFRDSFDVVIQGSNGYNAVLAPPVTPGFVGPISWKGAPQIPNDPTTGLTTYIGSKFYSFGLESGQVEYYSSEVCVSACSAQTAYNFAHPPTTKNPTVCNHVVSYMLSNPFGVPQGMYCAFYTESWDASYGTVTSAASVGGDWSVGYAHSYYNATYSATYKPITPSGYLGGNCGGWGRNTC